MEETLLKLTQRLREINRHNAEEEELRFLQKEEFPSELGDLIDAINQSLEEESRRLVRKRKSLKIINSIIHSGMWSMEFNEKGEMTNVVWSDAFRKMLGFHGKDEFPDTLESWSDRLHPDHKEQTLKAYWNAVRGYGYYDVEYQLMVKDGSYKWFRATGELDRRPDGTPSIFVGTFLDIDIQKQHHQMKLDTMRAKEENQAKTKFLAHISHDIRTPINGILGLVSVGDLYSNDLNRQADCRNKIRTTTEHLLSLINNVLDLTKLQSDTVEITEEPFEMDTLLDTCHMMVATQAEKMAVTLHDTHEPLHYPRVIGSALYVRQVLVNLISNAVKYNRPGGEVFFRIAEEKINDEQVLYTFTVQDTGIGMSEEFLEKIFDPYSQEGNLESSYKSTGLGMAITKSLIDQMDGTIQVESKIMKGSTFTVTIPLKLDTSPKTEELTDEDLSCAKGLHVLLCEDNAINREVAQCLLENAGVVVTCAKNGQEAYDKFLYSKPYELDAILMDVRMPLMDGYTATRQIRSLNRPDATKIPIFAMTANAFKEDIVASQAAGMDEHLSKPVDIQYVLRRLVARCKPHEYQP